MIVSILKVSRKTTVELHFFTLFVPNHFRLLVEALLMTGSDLCASAKPWDLQMQTVEVIYDEFYQQVRQPEILDVI